uniref:Uncharacterized protein n=1 Tax=Cucumis melo TaxID=3656 RepID=A0A9I9E4U4_CUCME
MMLIVIRMQKLAQEQNEKIEKVNRERKFHQVNSIPVIRTTVVDRPINIPKFNLILQVEAEHKEEEESEEGYEQESGDEYDDQGDKPR